MTRLAFAPVLLGALILAAGCDQEKEKAPQVSGGLSARKLGEVAGMSTPESVAFDPARNAAYVSNIQLTTPDGHWDDDNQAFIARIVDRKADPLKFKTGDDKARLSSPKGLAVLDGKLYAADINRVVVYDLAGTAEPVVIQPPDARGLNDPATDGKAVYVSDYVGNQIFRIAGDKAQRVATLEEINGITFAGGKLLAVTWEKTHDVFEVDPTEMNPPKPFGLAAHFKALDGIEALDDGTLIVSDYVAGKIFAVSPDRKAATVLIEGLNQPADIGLDKKNKVLYVPEMGANKVSVWQLEKK